MASTGTGTDVANLANERKLSTDSKSSSEFKPKTAIHALGKPFFGASGTMLKQFDEHHALSRKPSTDVMAVATPPRSVVGIGGKGGTIQLSFGGLCESHGQKSRQARLLRGEDSRSNGKQICDVLCIMLMSI